MRFRERAIENEHQGTCSWLLDTEEYKDWTAARWSDWRHGVLWIKGPPGSGKSTIVKFALDATRKIHDNGIVLAYFFNARGNDALQHSIQGMYRAILVQIMDNLPQDSMNELEKRFGGHLSTDWEVPELVRLLKAAVGLLDSSAIVVFVDALDECNGGDIRSMLLVLSSLVKQAWISSHQIRVCFASRPYPHITFDDAIFLDLDRQLGHRHDIDMYVHDNLKIGSGERADLIATQMRHKAAGVFMWAVLVLRVLNEEYDGGNVDRLAERLSEIPAGLHALFAHTLARYPANQRAMLSCFRWLLFAHHEVNATAAFWWAVQLDLGASDEDVERRRSEMTVEDMERYIVDKCKGLVTFGWHYAQFVHESVREFIRSDSQIWELCEAQSREQFEGHCYERLRDICVAELKARCPQILDVVAEKGVENLSLHEDFEGWSRNGHAELARFPFALKASASIWYYAAQAQERGKDQSAFLESLPDLTGPYFLMWKFEEGRLAWASKDIISALIWHDHPELIRQTQFRSVQRAREARIPFGLLEDGSQCIILGHALYFGCRKAAHALVDIYLRRERRDPQFQKSLTILARRIQNQDEWLYELSESCYGPLLDLTCGSTELTVFFLLTLASTAALQPYLNDLVVWIESPTLAQIARLVSFYIEKGIPLDGIDLVDQRSLAWAEDKRCRSATAEEADDHKHLAELLRERLPRPLLPLRLMHYTLGCSP